MIQVALLIVPDYYFQLYPIIFQTKNDEKTGLKHNKNNCLFLTGNMTQKGVCLQSALKSQSSVSYRPNERILNSGCSV